MKIENEDQVIAYSILGKLRPQAPSPPSTCIYRIPDPLKRLRKKDFVLSLVSIGPFHHGKKNLQAMEGIKLWYLHNLLIRKPTPETDMEHIVEKIRSKWKNIVVIATTKKMMSGEIFFRNVGG